MNLTNPVISPEAAKKYPNILKPLQIGGTTIPNRIARTPHQTTYAHGAVTEQLIAYHVARAKGGVGLTILETAAVHSTSPSYLDATTDEFIGGLARLVDACRPYGMKVFQQLTHGGTQSLPLDGSPQVSPSSMPFELEGVFPAIVSMDMTKTMIDEIVAGFAASSRRIKQSGADGVEFHAAHSYLGHQFLSHITNRRTDDYGGSLENRMRFTVETLTAMRGEVGKDFPIGIRLSATDFNKYGMPADEVGEVCARLEALGLVDYFSLSVGDFRTFNRTIATIFDKPGYQLPYMRIPGARIKKIPRLAIGRFVNLDQAEEVLASGDAEIVGMVRATIADPNHVNRTLSGKAPRPCITCNTCVSGHQAGAMRCAVNATVGYEYAREDDHFEPATMKKNIVIAGGGPAGLELARVAAMRGHKVTLFEARTDLGGQLRLASRVPGREAVGNVLTWLESQTRAAGVDIRLSTTFTPEFLDKLGPVDEFISAIGPARRPGFLQLAVAGFEPTIKNDANISTGAEVLMNPPEGNGRTALVLDDVGYGEGYGVALLLLSKGWKVAAVSRMALLAGRMNDMLYRETVQPLLFSTGRFTMYPHSYLDTIGKEVVVKSLYGAEDRRIAADLVIPVMFGIPNHGLAKAVEGRVGKVHMIGDSLAPLRHLLKATAEGNALGRSI